MKTSYLNKLALVAVLAAVVTLTGCNEANSKNSTAAQNKPSITETPDFSTVSDSLDAKARAAQEAKRDAEAGMAIY
jgi:hypothetical protein